MQALLPALPLPQAHALRVAFGLNSGTTVEPFLVALATLPLLADAAEATPVRTTNTTSRPGRRTT